MENKKIAVLQIDSILGDQQANLKKIDDMIAAIKDPSVRMAVFCEYGLSGYCTDLTKIAEPIPGSITDSLCKISKKHNIWISGGLPEKVSGGKIANASVMISPKDGLVATYRKIHPFGGERELIVYGDEPIVVDTELGKVGMCICYDFVFPELIRGLRLKGAEIIVNSTFWYSDKYSGPLGWNSDHTLAMATTRALENKVYVVMACRCGTEYTEDNVIRAFGYSAICDPMGTILARANLGETVIKAEIDEEFKRKCSALPYISDRRPEIYKKILDF
jgi:predicted amidohydrolase